MSKDWIWSRKKAVHVYGAKNRDNMRNTLIFLCYVMPFFCLAQQANEVLPAEENKESVLTELGTKYHNSIKLLQNRFRIDYEVDEITMVFFRAYGSAPIVLVRPDGSKIFQSGADGESVFWYDTSTYDMISIKNPMRGPWQAVGQILPDSRVMVLSDIKLHVNSLPDKLFSGEILKQTAYLTNGGKPIDYREFRDVVQLSIQFYSTNNPQSTNFGADMQTIATFEDNGKGMDEKPLDGTYTGQFNLGIPSGEWKPIFVVATPMFTREQVDPSLTLYPNPINLKVELDGGGGGYHKLLIDADREHIDINSLLIDGKIRFPNGDIQTFSITEPSANAREFLIVNYEYGIFRVKVTAYGKTVSGRDFILDVPEYTFLSEEIEPVAAPPVDTQTPPAETLQAPLDKVDNDQQNLQSMPVDEQEASMSTLNLVLNIVAINLVLLLAGGTLIWYISKGKSVKAQKKTSSLQENPSAQSTLAVMKDKMSGLFGKKNKPKDDSGMLNLSIPKD
jgi:uncharacterized protein (TIGR03503 family)